MSRESKHFLILDDEETIRQSIAAYMEDEGYRVFQAESTEQGLGFVKAHPIDAAVVDIRLPGEDGNTFMLEARKIRPNIKFVVHTGSADYVLPESILRLGVTEDLVLIKPVRDLSALCDILNRQS